MATSCQRHLGMCTLCFKKWWLSKQVKRSGVKRPRCWSSVYIKTSCIIQQSEHEEKNFYCSATTPGLISTIFGLTINSYGPGELFIIVGEFGVWSPYTRFSIFFP